MNQAIALALIANELSCNVFEHAFPGGRSGNVSVVLRYSDSDGVSAENSDCRRWVGTAGSRDAGRKRHDGIRSRPAALFTEPCRDHYAAAMRGRRFSVSLFRNR